MCRKQLLMGHPTHPPFSMPSCAFFPLLFSPGCCCCLLLLQEWVDVLEKDSNVWDQNAFNDLFRRGSRPLPERKDGLFE